MSVNLPARVVDYLDNTDIAQRMASGRPADAADDPSTVTLFTKLYEARARRDGSVTVQLTAGELDDLTVFVEAMENMAAQNRWNPDSRYDARVARVGLRRIGTAQSVAST